MKPIHSLGLVGAVLVGAFFILGRPGDEAPVPETGPGDLATMAALEDAGVIQVWKSPTCGCCSKWIEHLEEQGFEVETIDTPDMVAIKAQYGIPGELQSCHTALIAGYLIEGHVPAEDITRLLTERPEVTGLAVPGMPVGSPGMEMGDRVDPHDVLSFDGQGRTEVYSRQGR